MTARDASVDLMFAGDERHFVFAVDQLIAIQDTRNCAWRTIFNRLLSGAAYFEDIREVIRLGLIGGGTEPKRARDLCDEFVVPGRLGYCEKIAVTIAVAIENDGGEQVGKRVAATEAPETNASPLPPSSEPAQSSDTHRSKSAA